MDKLREPNIERLLAAFALKRLDRVPHFDFIDPANVAAILGREPAQCCRNDQNIQEVLPFGSPEAVTADVREHIARLAESLTTAVIGIIPFAARMPVYGVTGWVILDDLVTIETEGGDLEIADPEEAGRYWRYTELLRDIALTGSEAGAFCRQVAAETRGQRR